MFRRPSRKSRRKRRHFRAHRPWRVAGDEGDGHGAVGFRKPGRKDGGRPGVGKVGSRLVRLLVEEGARCLIADVDGRRVDALREEFRSPSRRWTWRRSDAVSCDIFAPCAGGGVINDKTVEELKCRAVVGSANNQLEDDRTATACTSGEFVRPGLRGKRRRFDSGGRRIDRIQRGTRHGQDGSIYDMLLKIYRLSREQNIPTYRAVDRLVAKRMEQVADLRRIFLGL